MHRIVIKIKIKKGALALFFDALFSSFANLSLKKRKHAAGAALVLAPGITLDAEKDRFVTLSWVVEWVFFSPATCQVKCNSKLEKISEGEFQLRHLRGR